MTGEGFVTTYAEVMNSIPHMFRHYVVEAARDLETENPLLNLAVPYGTFDDVNSHRRLGLLAVTDSADEWKERFTHMLGKAIYTWFSEECYDQEVPLCSFIVAAANACIIQHTVTFADGSTGVRVKRSTTELKVTNAFLKKYLSHDISAKTLDRKTVSKVLGERHASLYSYDPKCTMLYGNDDEHAYATRQQTIASLLERFRNRRKFSQDQRRRRRRRMRRW